MLERKELLKKHTNKIWEGKDGKWRTYLPDTAKGRSLIKRAPRKAVEDEVANFWKIQLENPTLQEIFDEWNDRRLELHKISPSSHLRLKQVFAKHYAEFGKHRIKDITEDAVADFLEHELADKTLSAKAFSSLKGVTRGMLKRAKRRKLMEINVEAMFLDLDVSEQEFDKNICDDQKEVFNESEMAKIMAYTAENPDIKNLGVALLFATGLRIGELVALRHSDFSENTISIRRTETRYKNSEGHYVYAIKDSPKTKAGKRTIVVPAGFKWVIDRLRDNHTQEGYVFVDEKGERINAGRMRKRVYALCRKLDIETKSPHKIRKTYGTILLDNHPDNRFIMEQMGHTDISCTENYYHRNRKGLDKKMELLDSIPEFNSCGYL